MFQVLCQRGEPASASPPIRLLSTARSRWLGLLVLAILSTTAAASPIEPCRPAVVCTVQVTELPVVLLSGGGYELMVRGQVPTPLPSTGIAHLALVEPSLVRLAGATYQGSVTIDPADCGGDAIHTIAAAPKPAKLEFQVGAVPLADLVISCIEGCAYQMRPADDFPELPFPRDDTELVVELMFKARGHRSQIAEFRLTPGVNQVRVTLAEI